MTVFTFGFYDPTQLLTSILLLLYKVFSTFFQISEKSQNISIIICRLHHSKVTVIFLLKLLHYELGTLIYCALQALFQTMHFFPLLSHFMHIITLVLREDQGYERPHFLSRLQFLSPPNLVINQKIISSRLTLAVYKMFCQKKAKKKQLLH